MFKRADLLNHRRTVIRNLLVVAGMVSFVALLTYFIARRPSMNDFEIVDALGGNLFPSAILSVATTDASIIRPLGPRTVGKTKTGLAVKLRSRGENTRVRVELASTPFYEKSVSYFTLPVGNTDYYVYPDIIWRYDALRANTQAEPVNVVAHVELNDQDCGLKVRTFSMRSVNECLLGYNLEKKKGEKPRYVNTRLFFAAYVNEENPLIDIILREALNTKIVRRFDGYQVHTTDAVDKQVYAIWYALQKRNFRYSSVSYTSLSTDGVYAQRVRTFEDALNSSQINCVDGSALFASLLRAINITPVLVRTPGHMFVGYYNDESRKELTFLETTMIGDVDLDSFFPDEKPVSSEAVKTPAERSRLAFERSKQYASKAFKRAEKQIRSNKQGYMFLEINKSVRRQVQPIGK